MAREAELAKVGLPSQTLARYRDGGGSTCSFWFVHADKIRTSDATMLPNLQQLRKTHAAWLVQKEITFAEGYRGAYKKTFLAISHRWEKPGEPDTLGVQFAAIRKHLVDHPEIQFVWYDVRSVLPPQPDTDVSPLPTVVFDSSQFWSMPQGRIKTEVERIEFTLMLPNINLLYLFMRVQILLVRSPCRRSIRCCRGPRAGHLTCRACMCHRT